MKRRNNQGGVGKNGDTLYDWRFHITTFFGCLDADVLGSDWAELQVYGDGALGAGEEVEVELYPGSGDGAGPDAVLPAPAHQRSRLILHRVHGTPA